MSKSSLTVPSHAYALYAEGKIAEALAAATKGMATRDPFLLNLAAICHLRLDHPEQAVTCWRQALSIHPDSAEIYNNLGNLLKSLARFDEAEVAYRQAIRLKPDYAEACYNLGNLFKEIKRYNEAEAAYQQALSIRPDFASACNNLGNLLQTTGRHPEAEVVLRQAIRLKPDHAEAHYNLGNLLQENKRGEEAEVAYRQAIRLKPDHIEAYCNLGYLLQELKRFAEAEAAYRQALRIKPNHAKTRDHLGHLFQHQQRFEEAEIAYRQAVTLQPDNTDYLAHYGSCLFTMGRMDDAIAYLRKALQDHPQSADLVRTYSAVLLYEPSLTSASRHALRCQAVAGLSPPEFTGERHRPIPAQPRRIAIVSSDFRQHPVAGNVLPLLEHLNRQHFEILCYAERVRVDDTTSRFQVLASAWRWTKGLSDHQVARQMMEDQVDVALYLAGHFDANRSEICRYRPAPLQISYYDGASSGLPEMDYCLTDSVLHPAGCQEPYSERLYHLPVLYQYHPIVEAPDPGEPPVLSHSVITFGSFNNPCKVNSQVLDLWCEALRAIPQARLCLKYQSHYDNPSVRNRLLSHFTRQGIDQGRVLLEPGCHSYSQHLMSYHEVDIALDTFPFTGATTTFEALWMGVPVVTLAGDSFISRMTASILHHGGLEPWVANTPQEFIAILERLAADLPALALWRRTLRQCLASSPLCQGDNYARSVEKGLLAMWQGR